MTPMRVPFLTLTPGEDLDAVRTAMDRVIARGWFVSAPRSNASRPSSRPPRAPATRSASATGPMR